MTNITREEIDEVFESIFFPKLEYRSIKKDYTKRKNVNNKLCEACKGVCCKRCGCHFSPDDFKEISFDYLKKEIEEKGYISIDYVDGEIILADVGAYILRTRNTNAPIVDCSTRHTPCSLLTPKGCKLNYEKRPTGGKLLIPKVKISEHHKKILKCHQNYTIQDCCYEWKPHQKILTQLIEYFSKK